MKIAFTGHRNRFASQEDLQAILDRYPGAVWVHGGAVGFDSQVERFAQVHGVKTIVIRPDYGAYGPAVASYMAPLTRNQQIVDQSDMLVALWDGRKRGGTFFTINYAKSKNLPVELLSPK